MTKLVVDGSQFSVEEPKIREPEHGQRETSGR